MNAPCLEVILPQLGVNDEEAIIVQWLAVPGEEVAQGQPIAVVETTKATVELAAEGSGFFYPLVEPDTKVSVRDVIAVILSQPDEGAVQRYREAVPKEASPTQGPRMTDRARQLAEEHDVDPERFPAGRIVRERDVLALVGETAAALDDTRVDPARRVAIYGASQGGRAVMECLQAMGGYEVAAFLDDDPERIGSSFYGLPVSSGEELGRLPARGVGAVATHIAQPKRRLALRDRALAAGVVPINVIHPSAVVSASVRMGVGNLVKAGAVLDAEVRLGDCCIIDNGAILPHHNRVGDACHIAPGVVLGGDCYVGDGSVIGIGATVSARISIGRNVIVGPGACVVRDIPDDAVVEGHPAKVVGQRRAPS